MSVLVYAENWEGYFKKPTFEAVYFAADAAQKLNTYLTALIVGDVSNDEAKKLGQYGVQKIVRVNRDDLQSFSPQPYASVLEQFTKEKQAQLLVLPSSFNGKSLGPRTAAKLDAGLVSGVIAPVNMNNGFVVRKPVFSSKGFASVRINSDIKMVSVEPNSIGFEENPVEAEIEDKDIQPEEEGFTYEVIEQEKEEGKVPLNEAEKVVSGGRGLKGPDNWHLLEDFAQELGASLACSKPVSDMEWRPHSEHVGQTGTTIRPNLYFAVGISGAIQHQAGVSNSKIIVAINKDPEAPIFKLADYGIVGDAFEVMPKLIEAAKEKVTN